MLCAIKIAKQLPPDDNRIIFIEKIFVFKDYLIISLLYSICKVHKTRFCDTMKSRKGEGVCFLTF